MVSNLLYPPYTPTYILLSSVYLREYVYWYGEQSIIPLFTH